MIAVETKAESVASQPLGLSNSKDEKPSIPFSHVLHGAKETKDDKGIQNGSFVVSLGLDAKEKKPGSDKETLTSLLKNDKQIEKGDIKLSKGEELVLKEKIEVLELNPKVTQNLSVAELKALIADAKKFLKDKILDSVEYKKEQGKDLPKTLKGLAQVAKNFGIDVSKITLEEIRVSAKPLVEKQNTIKAVELKPAQTDTVSEEKVPLSKETPKLDAAGEETVDVKTKLPKTLVNKAGVEQTVVEEVKLKEETKESVKMDDKKVELIKEIKSTPLFKSHEKLEHTTAQLVQTKQFQVEEKTPKVRADETLKLLLRGEKPSQKDTHLGMTKDFSVATARVIAPQAMTENTKSIESLLRGDRMDDTAKMDVSLSKDVDSLDVKVKEAKQMMKYLSADVKTAIEDYKSPFTKIKVQLNPAKMGEVDLTVVQRGKNLHVSLTSNNVAINTLAMNVNDLKAQLTNSGIQNATFNFSNSSQNSEQNSQQQRNRENERQANEEYNYFENEEQNEEILNSLEIIVPAYA